MFSSRQINGLALRRQLRRDRRFEISDGSFKIQLVGWHQFLKSGQIAQRVEARVLADLNKEVMGVGIGLKPRGVQIKRDPQIFHGRISFAEHGFQRSKVVAWFGLVGCEGGEFLEDGYQSGQVAELGGNLGHGGNVRVAGVRTGQRLIEQLGGIPEQFNGAVGLLHLHIEVRQLESILEVGRIALLFSLHLL